MPEILALKCCLRCSQLPSHLTTSCDAVSENRGKDHFNYQLVNLFLSVPFRRRTAFIRDSYVVDHRGILNDIYIHGWTHGIRDSI
jgi:hypothetical protein